MTPERWGQIREKLEVAVAMEPGSRSAYLVEIGTKDPDLRNELESLLGQDSSADFLKTSAMFRSDVSTRERDAMIGLRLGPYRVTELLGVGGMGEVYRAFRADDEFRQQVAIKLVRAGADSPLVVSRFKNERQILAGLDHPHIARLLDGGTTQEGVPYLVMELIAGQPIDEYCDAHELDVSQRLRLFLDVCSAVQYAHSRLLVHRDLKPGNVLVTADGTVKLLDFGIAKILDPSRPGEDVRTTMTMLRVLTPAYASPEQVKGETITTASDVYSLGVVLYELLTGHHPYRVTRNPDAMSHAILEVEPERPSSAVRRTETPSTARRVDSTPAPVSTNRAVAPEKLQKQLSGDLDNIVLMALRKEPARRYASAEQLAEDIRRHLESLPVLARRDTPGYRAGKFVARHRAGTVAGALAVMALIGALLVTLHQARIARQRFSDLRSLANSMVFDVHDSIKDLPGSTPARKLIVAKGLQYLDSLATESKGDASLQRELADAYTRIGDVQGLSYWANLGDTAGAMKSYQKALAIRQEQLKNAPRDLDVRAALATSYERIADVLMTMGQTSKALDEDYQALAIREAVAAGQPASAEAQARLAQCHNSLGGVLTDFSNWNDALKHYQASLSLYQSLARAHPESVEYHRMLGVMSMKVASVYEELGESQQAVQQARQAVAVLEELVPSTSSSNMMLQRNLASAHFELGGALLKAGQARDGLAQMAEATATNERLLAKDPLNERLVADLAIDYTFLGNSENQQGQNSAALRYYGRALQQYERRVKQDPMDQEALFGLAGCYRNIGSTYEQLALRHGAPASEQQARCSKALPWLRKALQVWLVQEEKLTSHPNAKEIEEVKHSIAACDTVLNH